MFNTHAPSLSTQHVKMAMTIYTLMDEQEERMSDDYQHRSSSNCCLTGHRSRAAQERAINEVCPADDKRGDPPHLEGSFHDTP
jgi:hypothetical protein